MSHVEPLTVTVPQAAKLIGVGTTTAWELVHSGRLRSVRLGRRVLIPRSAIIELLGEDDQAA
jgi:excisionase family DNA binding protein